MFNRPHWSYSQLAQYMRCPLQYFFERIAGLPVPFSSSSLVLGSAVHAALADYHRGVQSGQRRTADAIRDTFLNEWYDRESLRPVQYREGEQRGDVIDQGIALLEFYQRQEPPTQIVGVEQRLAVPVFTSDGEILDRPLVAIIDLMHRKVAGLVVTEFKTAARRYPESQADTALQLSAYVHAVQQKYDELAEVQFVVLVKTKTPQVQVLPTTRSQPELGRFGDVVQSVQRAIDAGAYYPIENPMNCSGCPFRLPCLDWRGSGRPAAVALTWLRPQGAAPC